LPFRDLETNVVHRGVRTVPFGQTFRLDHLDTNPSEMGVSIKNHRRIPRPLSMTPMLR
jgi:hypothetical protein